VPGLFLFSKIDSRCLGALLEVMGLAANRLGRYSILVPAALHILILWKQ
jgi:hypothetical protein